MGSLDQYVIFVLDENRYMLPLSEVERVVPAVYITPLPQAPDIVSGIINVQGQVLPVVNLRRRFHLPERSLELTDQFIIAHTPQRTVALTVDRVIDVLTIPQHTIIHRTDIVSSIEHIAGVATQEDDMILIHDLESCLSFEEERALHAALQAA